METPVLVNKKNTIPVIPSSELEDYKRKLYKIKQKRIERKYKAIQQGFFIREEEETGKNTEMKENT